MKEDMLQLCKMDLMQNMNEGEKEKGKLRQKKGGEPFHSELIYLLMKRLLKKSYTKLIGKG